MNRLLTLTLAAVAAGALVAADFADAKRMGGGRSLGAQRSAPSQPAQSAIPPSAAPSKAAPDNNFSGPAAAPVMPRQATPGTPAGAAQPSAAAAKAAPGAAAPASGMSRWLGPVAGLAAGLGLAALASHLGIAQELMSVLLLVGLALVAFVAIRMLLARRAPQRPAMQYAGAPIGNTTPAPGYEAQVPPRTFEPLAPAPAGVAAARPAPVANVPADFDAEGFLRVAKHQFTRLQGAFDRGDRAALADVMTPALLAEIVRDLPAGTGQATEIVALNAELVEVATEGSEHWASVRFRGLTREDGEPMPKAFDEMWNLVKPADGGSGWMLAGIQQLEPAGAGHA